ncbi:hypothetical protein BTS2_0871 [Bacillus sp. TS-2]|nr:hypothetical protein BTS2_0871 [Bacillus sp. TS-2]
MGIHKKIQANKDIADTLVFINHVGDNDLKELLQESVESGKTQVQQISELLKANGVALPPAAPEAPKTESNDIPVGARFPDADVAE